MKCFINAPAKRVGEDRQTVRKLADKEDLKWLKGDLKERKIDDLLIGNSLSYQ